jgi:hypothetical protein
MLRLDKVIKPWKESASLNDHINSEVGRLSLGPDQADAC